MAGVSLEQLQERIGYRFHNPQVLSEALTHSSFAQETSERVRDNEQLEFLGDAVLNFVVSVRLADAFPQYEEGKLSRARARLVAADHLAKVAARLELGEYLRLGRGEEKTGGRSKSNLLVDALEALVAALFRDGGLEEARRFVEGFILPADLAAQADELFATDYKSALQEYLQAEHEPPADYHVVEESGPEHQKTFTVEVTTRREWAARGRGGSKKAAEQQAARTLLERLGNMAEAHDGGE
ncbi:MAG: ribonuclease III [Acidobacteriia bacterium]|nr:ribonuclease III [Terriglobia bacterium]